ncbi:SusC/RagA family TonB-linked outer membrane protein [Flavihumibacter solisilvae]|uniref:TonB-dependent receptor n=1 Tax=Flavihumibacter solisilvae TaxID=1349421 RepID=A0A0C1L5T6_9BACT|nr:TonB-dependent receptor [Flavihumibacter solisilvae]KIC94876.1 TonB-dependent receptor [Flavihumibacter solisilvae]
MGNLKSLLVVLLLTCISGLAVGQTISGEVVDKASQQPISGATVRAGDAGTSTDDSGKFSFTAPDGTKSITISSVGYGTITVKVGSGNIRIQLEHDDKSLEQVVVVGYGTQKKANLTGAVSTVNVTKQMQSRPMTDPARALQGAVPGLTISTTTGDLGSNPQIRLRGVTGSLNAANGAQPLILVDNVEIPSLMLVNPEDIEAISVLKDAASTSIYGSRAAFGVVLITTKTGKKNSKSRITYSNNFSWSTPTTTPKIADAADGPEYALAAAIRTNPNNTFFGTVGMTFDEASIQKIRDWQKTYGGQDLGPEMVEGRDFEDIGGKKYFYRPWDAVDLYMKKWTPQQNHNLNFTGGNDKTSYNVNLGYLDQKGVLTEKTDLFKRYNASFSINSAVTPWLDLTGKVMMSKTEQETPFSYNGTAFDPLYYLYRWHGVYPYGTFQGKPFRNVITEMQQANMVEEARNFLRTTVGGTFKITKGLTLNTNYTYTNNNNHIKDPGGVATAWNQWNAVWVYGPYSSATYNRIAYYSEWNELHTVKAFATYQKDIKDHDFKVIAGMDVDLYKPFSQGSEKQNLIDQTQPELPLATGNMITSGGRVDWKGIREWTTQGFFGRINYTFRNKFLLEVNGRFDGSSYFPSNDRWAFFPSVSAGYIISDEKFMDFAAPVLSHLKLRASYGSLGNTDVGSATFRPSMSSSTSGWWIGSTNMLTVNTPALVPPVLKWETIKSLDFGFDARLLNNKVGVSFDWYRRTTSDMITSGEVLPATFGATPPKRNYGEMQTTGWEIAIDLNHGFSNGLNINGTLSFSDFKEEITKYDGNNINGYYKGKQLGEIWGYRTDRFFTKDDFEQDASGNLITDASGHYIPAKGVPTQSKHEASWFFYGPGDIKYKDLNGDGTIFTGAKTLDDHGDMVVIGNSTPRYQYGIRLGADWKGIDFNLFIQGVGKRDYWGTGMIVIPGFNPSDNMYAHQMDYWTPENPDAFYPRPSNTGQSNDAQNFLVQDKYMLNMAYMRLKSVGIGYTIPAHLTQKAKLQRMRIYVNGENLFEKENLSVPIDPEVGFKNASSQAATFGRVYPYRRTVSFGIQATL